MKKLITLLTILTLLVSGTVVALANDNAVKVYVDGVKVQFPDQEPIINSDNRTLVPVRFVSEALGADVEWNSVTREVTIEQRGQSVRLGIGNKHALMNGSKTVTFDTTASILSDRTMVPLRFVSECLKAQVEWKAAERAVYVTTLDENSDRALVTSDLIIRTAGEDNKPHMDFSVLVDYGYNKKIGPQLEDLHKLLEKRYGFTKAKEIVDYIALKDDAWTRIEDRKWTIDGITVEVFDNGGSVNVRA